MGESINEKLERIAKQNEEILGGTGKKFKLPWHVRLGAKGKIKQGQVLVQYIRNNGKVNFKWSKLEDNCVIINDQIHDARAGNVLNYNGIPFLIVPEWNIKPISPNEEEETPKSQPLNLKENFDEAEKKGQLTSTHKLILTKMKMEAVKPSTQFNMKTVLILLGLLAVGYFILDYMKLL